MNVLILTTSIPAAACLGSAANTVSASCDYGINVSLHQCLNWEFNAMRRGCVSQLDRQQPLATLGNWQ